MYWCINLVPHRQWDNGLFHRKRS